MHKVAYLVYLNRFRLLGSFILIHFLLKVLFYPPENISFSDVLREDELKEFAILIAFWITRRN